MQWRCTHPSNCRRGTWGIHVWVCQIDNMNYYTTPRLTTMTSIPLKETNFLTIGPDKLHSLSVQLETRSVWSNSCRWWSCTALSRTKGAIKFKHQNTSHFHKARTGSLTDSNPPVRVQSCFLSQMCCSSDGSSSRRAPKYNPIKYCHLQLQTISDV